jgi:hypothetical protein
MNDLLNTEVPHAGQKTLNRSYSGKRLVVKAVVRDSVYGPGIMLLDGRAYPAGEHLVQVWAEDLPAMEALVEQEEHMLSMAKSRHELKLNEYINKTRRADGSLGINKPQSYDGSIEVEFLDLTRRPLKPLLNVEVVSTLDSVANEEKIEQARMLKDLAPNTSAETMGTVELMAEMLKTIKSLNAKVEKLEGKK